MTIAFVGDVWLSGVTRIVGPGLPAVVANLEGPITTHGDATPGKIALRNDGEALLGLFGANLAAVSLANNHILDFGEPGLRDTIAFLDEHGVPWFGVDLPGANRSAGLILLVDGVRVGFLGYACTTTSVPHLGIPGLGVPRPELSTICEDLEGLRRRGAARIVLCIHWGAEEVPIPKPADVRLAREAVMAGADLVIGHHAHVVQPCERHGTGVICYGLGNCVMSDVDVQVADEYGRTTRFTKRQAPWHRRSLGILYEPATSGVAVRRLRVAGGQLHVSSRSIAIPRRLGGVVTTSQGIYRVAHVVAKAVALFWGWWARPRWPSRRALKGALRLMLGGK